jgi:3-methyl-2-oxobutanoate hydroxymethyltransferase
MVKIEGGGWTAPMVRFLVDRGIPVCAHLGFTPQSVHALGGYRIQGRGETVSIPVIGIGAGSGCHGQVLVTHDMLNITHGRLPRFVRNFMEGSGSIQDAIRLFVGEVKSGAFPDDAQHGY